MRFAGIIAEYDPFHNGHAWQLAQARALGAQRVAVAMSCGLTQRGALPLLPESVRVRAALDPLLRRVPPAVGVAVSALLFWVTYPTMNGFWNLPGGRLALPQALYASYTTAYLGFMPKSFFSTDYFPLLPWLFLFWAGYFLHHLVGRGRLAPLRRSVCPPLGWMGRHSLVLYLLHQPVILGVLTVAFRLVRAG